MITCPVLSEVDDGAIDYSSGGGAIGITFGTVATHSCDEGFYLSGGDSRVCSSNGTSIYGVWDTFAPECIGKYHLMCGNVNREQCYFVMFRMYYRKIEVNKLSNHLTIIAAVTCDALPNPTSGNIQYSTGTDAPFDYLTTATYCCVEGYGLSGVDTIRTCISSPDGPGVWNGIAPTCEGIPMLSLNQMC